MVKAVVKRKELEKKVQKKGVWKLNEKKRERLKGVYVRAKSRLMKSLEGK